MKLTCRIKKIKKVIILITLISASVFVLCGCSNIGSKVTVTVFAAKSLGSAMEELIEVYSKEHPDIIFIDNYDGSGILKTQIEEGARCDIFIPASQKEMTALQEAGFVERGTRANLISNKVCFVASKICDTEFTGLKDIKKAESIALAAGSVPVGYYTRTALVNMDIIEYRDEPAKITSEELSAELNGITINECANVGVVAAAVAEGANDVGTIYYSDYKGYEDKMDIIEIISDDLTGDVTYPIAAIVNDEASDRDRKAALDFIEFLKSDRAKAVFEKYYFTVIDQ